MFFAPLLCKTYTFWWNKPFTAEHLIVVRCSKHDAFEKLWWRRRELSLEHFGDLINVETTLEERIPAKQLILYAAATVFSAIHLAAWNWDFPSYIYSRSLVALPPISHEL